MGDEDAGGLRSVNRALRALELIAEAGELGVTELGRRLGVHKATASRLAATLARRGLIERDPVSDRYRLGFGLIRLAGAAMAGLDLVSSARPVLEELAEQTRETVTLGVISGDDVVSIDQVTGTRSIVRVSWVGKRTPLHTTSSGKVLLAAMNDAELDRRLDPADRDRSWRAPDPARRGPPSGLGPDARGARGGPERGCGAGPTGQRRGGGGPVGLGPGLPHAAR